MYVRGTDNVLKRVLVQAAAFNIGLLLRKLSGWGKPRQAQGRRNALIALVFAGYAIQSTFRTVWNWHKSFGSQLSPEIMPTPSWRVVFQ